MRLPPSQQAEIETRYANGESQRGLAREYGVDERRVRDAVHGRLRQPPAPDLAAAPGHCRVCGRPTPLHCSPECKTADESAHLALQDHVRILTVDADGAATLRSAWRLRCLMGVVDIRAGLSTPEHVAREIREDVRAGRLRPHREWFADMAGVTLVEWLRRRAAV